MTSKKKLSSVGLALAGAAATAVVLVSVAGAQDPGTIYNGVIQGCVKTSDGTTRIVNNPPTTLKTNTCPSGFLPVNWNGKGEKGDKGDPGAPGAKGDQGDPGDPGAPGAKGDQGDPGDPGAPGAKGDHGDPGDPGTPGAKGDQGDPGTPGAKGDQGDPGAPGAKGDQGDPGTPGAKGDQGDPGTFGTISVVTGTPATSGNTATATCSEGSTAVGGGYSETDNKVVSQSFPAGPTTNPTGWTVKLAANLGSGKTLTVYALCATH